MATRYWIGTGGTTGDWNDADNWSGGTKPTTGDTAVVNDTASADATANLGALTGVALAAFIVRKPGATVGTAANHAEIDADEIIIDMGGTGESLYLLSEASDAVLKVDAGATGSGVVQVSGEIDISTTGVQGGSVAFVVDPNFGSNAIATAVAAGARIAGGTVTATTDVTWAGGLITGGTLTSAANIGTWTGTGGTITTTGSATATVELIGGTLNHQSTGTVASATVRQSSTLTDAGQAWTLTTLKMDGGANVRLGDAVTVTNAIELLTDGRGPTVGAGSTLTLSTPGA